MLKLRVVCLLSVLSLAACSSSSSSSPSSPDPSAAYAGTYDYTQGAVVVTCAGAPMPIKIDLAQEHAHFTNTATGPETFHHKDVNACEFDFVVANGSATTSGGKCTTVPDGKGGNATMTVGTFTFTSSSDGAGITVHGDGSYAGCPMTLDGVAARR